VTAGDLCPAVLYDREEERVVCVQAPHILGAWSFICRRCLEIMLRQAADQEAERQEWEEDK
jgi:hypothetical protein